MGSGTDATGDISNCDDGSSNPCKNFCEANGRCTGRYQWTCDPKFDSVSTLWYFIINGVCSIAFTSYIFKRRQSMGLDVSQGKMVGHCIGCFCCSLLWLCIYFCMESNETSQRPGVWTQSNQPMYAGQPGMYAQPIMVQPGMGHPQGQMVVAVPVQGQQMQDGTYAQMPPPAYQGNYMTTTGQPGMMMPQQPMYQGQPYTMDGSQNTTAPQQPR
jgi:hypothetical protein